VWCEAAIGFQHKQNGMLTEPVRPVATHRLLVGDHIYKQLIVATNSNLASARCKLEVWKAESECVTKLYVHG
jgi:hypothetical protein